MSTIKNNKSVLYITEPVTTVNIPVNTYNVVIVLATVTNIKMPLPSENLLGSSIIIRNLIGTDISVQDHDGVELCNTESNKYTWIVLTETGYVSLHCDHGGPPPTPGWNFKYNILPVGLDYTYFGSSTSLSNNGNVFALGWALNGSSVGQVNIYNRSGFVWNFVTTLIPEDSFINDYFGFSVALNSDGTALVIGAPALVSGTPGAVWVYNYSALTGWTKTDKILISGANNDAQIGYSVSINAAGDIIAFGGPSYTVDTSGSVWVYKLISGTWTLDEQIYSTGLITGSRFGNCVALNAAGNRLITGDTYYDITTFNFGAFSIFEDTGTWNLMGSPIVPPGLSVDNLVGAYGSISGIGDTIAFGSPTTGNGTVWIYKYITGVWTLYDTITPPIGYPVNAGYNTALDYTGTTLVFNSSYYNEGFLLTEPSFYVYDEIGGVWTFNKNIIADTDVSTANNYICISPDGHYASMSANDWFEKVYINLYSNL